MKITFPLRTGRGENAREHHMARARRVRNERAATAWEIRRQAPRHEDWPVVPCLIRLTRVAPSRGLDDDNLAGALKAIRDEVAAWMGIDDRHADQVRYVYAQRRGPWAVEIEPLPYGPGDSVPFEVLLGVF